jgi:N-acyl-D-aspartate/D-glutamate deacylase
MGLNCTLNPFPQLASFREIASLPLAQKVEQLKDQTFRDQLLSEQSPEGGPALLLTNYEKIWVLGDPPNFEPAPEDSLAARARREGVSPASLALDAMLLNDGEQMLYTPFANYAENNLDCCREMILEGNTVMGLGDGGAHVGTICDASFVTHLLTHWGRDRTRDE